jgi:hypothetical protein
VRRGSEEPVVKDRKASQEEKGEEEEIDDDVVDYPNVLNKSAQQI